MKQGTIVRMTLISSSDSLKNSNIYTDISVKLNSLQTAIHGEGLEIWRTGKHRHLEWTDGTEQIRIDIELVLTKNKTKNEVYKIVNEVQARPLTFSKYQIT